MAVVKKVLYFLSIFLLLLVITAIGVTICWKLSVQQGLIRYKVSVEIQTASGTITASTVRAASMYYEPSILPEQGGYFYNIRSGEAIMVDLAGNILFVLMGGAHEASIAYNSFSIENGRKKVELQEKNYPKLVHFSDLKDPNSVELVSDRCPLLTEEVSRVNHCFEKARFEALYGAGSYLKSIVFEKTEEAVPAFVIIEALPWLNQIKGYINGKSIGGGAALSSRLDKGDFLRSPAR